MQYTYNTLLASCVNYCIDNSVEYTNEFPKIVQLSEMRIIKDLNLSVFDTVATGMMTLGSADLAKPSDMIVVQDLFVIVNGAKVYLQDRSKSYLDSYWPDQTITGTPVYYADNTTDLWQIAPTPDSSYNYEVNYIVRPTSMSFSNQNTWMGDKLGECLLYATLVGSASFFREDPATENGMIALWEKSYEVAINQAIKELSPMISAKDNLLFKLTTMGQ